MSGLFYFLEIINQMKLAVELNNFNVYSTSINLIKLKGKDFALRTNFFDFILTLFYLKLNNCIVYKVKLMGLIASIL